MVASSLAIDVFDGDREYPQLREALQNMRNICEPDTEKPTILLMFLYSPDAPYSDDIISLLIRKRNGMFKPLKSRFKNLRLMLVSLAMKQIRSIFSTYYFPSFLLLDYKLAIIRSYSLRDFLGDELTILGEEWDPKKPLPKLPRMKLKRCITRAICDYNAGKIKAKRSEILRRLKQVISKAPNLSMSQHIEETKRNQPSLDFLKD